MNHRHRCELLQNVYLCISTYNLPVSIYARRFVVNCFKMCIFALARTTVYVSLSISLCCELLQNVYLCISTYNYTSVSMSAIMVVNCFKMCIFALARTTLADTKSVLYGCELLQNVYLCISTYNWHFKDICNTIVVNCFKMCIFALARTTRFQHISIRYLLWIASKCVSLH